MFEQSFSPRLNCVKPILQNSQETRVLDLFLKTVIPAFIYKNTFMFPNDLQRTMHRSNQIQVNYRLSTKQSLIKHLNSDEKKFHEKSWFIENRCNFFYQMILVGIC